MKLNKNKRLSFTLRLLITAGALVYLVYRIDWTHFLQAAENIKWPFFLFAFIFFIGALIPCALRWKIVLKACDYPMSAVTAFKGYLIGAFFNAFLPTGRGGDVIRGYMASQSRPYPLSGLLSTILVERMIGFIMAVSLGFVTSLLAVTKTGFLKNALISQALLLLFVFFVLLFLLVKSIRHRMLSWIGELIPARFQNSTQNIVTVLNRVFDDRILLVKIAGLSFLNHLILIFSGFWVAQSISGFYAPFYSFFVVIPLVFVVALLPSVGGYGVREASYLIGFQWFGVAENTAAVYGILQLIMFWITAVLGAIVYLSSGLKNESENITGEFI